MSCYSAFSVICYLLPMIFTGETHPGKPPIQVHESLKVKKCMDFELTGSDMNPTWQKTEWVKLNKLDPGSDQYETLFKILYSNTGIYVIFKGRDNKITTDNYQDFENIFNGDVFEVFFHPDPSRNLYFEYEVNALDKELILVLSRFKGTTNSWVPWKSRKNGIKSIVQVSGGSKDIHGHIKSWQAEIYFPYTALGILPGIPPERGSVWKANFCRLDYDTGDMIKWSWSPGIKQSFHELEQFQSIQFE